MSGGSERAGGSGGDGGASSCSACGVPQGEACHLGCLLCDHAGSVVALGSSFVGGCHVAAKCPSCVNGTQVTISGPATSGGGGVVVFEAGCTVSLAVSAASDACPAWLQNYVDWHAQHRQEREQPAITLQCQDASREPGGLGDHMRGAMWALRLAAASNRLFFVDWRGSFSLTGHLEPTQIDWTPVMTRGDRLSVPASTKNGIYHDASTFKQTEELGQLLVNSSTDLVLCTSEVAGAGLPSALSTHPAAAWPVDLALLRCLWHSLFKPSASVLRWRDKQLRHAFRGAPPAHYIATHLRLGGLEGETSLIGIGNRPAECRFLDVFAIQSCAQKLNSSQHTVLITDNRILRAIIATHAFTGVVGPAGTASHIRLSGANGTVDGHPRASNITQTGLEDLFADLAILAHADCLITSSSGFSNIANWWSTSRCSHTVRQCLLELDAGPGLNASVVSQCA